MTIASRAPGKLHAKRLIRAGAAVMAPGASAE